jgi:hypothetical protein
LVKSADSSAAAMYNLAGLFIRYTPSCPEYRLKFRKNLTLEKPPFPPASSPSLPRNAGLQTRDYEA